MRFFFLLFVAILGTLYAKNQEITPNDLGITSTTCADTHCLSLDSMELWFQLQPICHTSASSTSASALYSTTSSDSSWKFSAHTTGLVCAAVSILGLIAGRYAGYKYFTSQSFDYDLVPNDDKYMNAAKNPNGFYH